MVLPLEPHPQSDTSVVRPPPESAKSDTGDILYRRNMHLTLHIVLGMVVMPLTCHEKTTCSTAQRRLDLRLKRIL